MNRFLPREAEEWLDPGDRPPYGRTRAVESLLAAYRARPRVLLGLGLWLGAVGGVVAVLVGTILLADGVDFGDLLLAGLGAALLLLGVVGVVACSRLGIELLRAGRALSRGMVSWLGDEGRPHDLEGRLFARRAVYRGPIFVRAMLCSLTSVGAVLGLSAVGFVLSEIPAGDGQDRVLLALLGAAAAALSALCVVAAVATARAAHRLQRVVVWRFLRGE